MKEQFTSKAIAIRWDKSEIGQIFMINFGLLSSALLFSALVLGLSVASVI